jgi:hypothetical protein
MNGNCDFMQAQTHYTNETQCKASIDAQKIHMLKVAETANQGKYTVLEGTCINARISDPKKQA